MQRPAPIPVLSRAARAISVIFKIERIDAEANRQIGGWQEGFDPFYGAPVILAVLADRNWANRVYNGSLVMGNLMLAAHSLGLGSIGKGLAIALSDILREVYPAQPNAGIAEYTG